MHASSRARDDKWRCQVKMLMCEVDTRQTAWAASSFIPSVEDRNQRATPMVMMVTSAAAGHAQPPLFPPQQLQDMWVL